MIYPKISIVTPNFNGSKYLEETIISVLGQNYPNLEYIIVDGGSTDKSLNIIDKYRNKLTWWISEPDNGMYHAIQKGFEHSSGEIMAWINSDDMYHKNSFFSIAEIFDSLRMVNWIVGASSVFDESGRTIFVSQSRRFSKFDFYNHDFKWIQQESVFWRRSLWEKSGSKMDTNLKYAGDLALWLRFFSHEKLFITDALIGGFRWLKSGQISRDHIDEYIHEADNLIYNVDISKNDRSILLNYKRFLRVVSFLKMLKFLNTNWIIQKYRSKYLSKPSVIKFDRDNMKFVLSDYY